MPTTISAVAFSKMRQHLDFSQRQFAFHIGEIPSFVSRTENGKTEPSVTKFFDCLKTANFKLLDPQQVLVAPDSEVKYLSLMYAFNTPPKTLTKTGGDWHSTYYFSKPLNYSFIGNNPLGAWGIDNNVAVPNSKLPPQKVANHVRAYLDLLYLGKFNLAKTAKEDFITTDFYNSLIFKKVKLFINLPHWQNIDKFLVKNYSSEWINYKNKKIYD